MVKVSAIIMAAGFSERMGKNKLFLRYKEKTFLARTLELVQQVDFYEQILVISPENAYGLTFSKSVKVIYNKQAATGQNSSVRLGTKNASGEGYLFLPIDQPLLDSTTINRLLKAATTKNIVFPVGANDQPSSPVYFGREFRKELLEVVGEGGGRSVRNANRKSWLPIFIKDTQTLRDIDTLFEYEQLCQPKKSVVKQREKQGGK